MIETQGLTLVEDTEYFPESSNQCHQDDVIKLGHACPMWSHNVIHIATPDLNL